MRVASGLAEAPVQVSAVAEQRRQSQLQGSGEQGHGS